MEDIRSVLSQFNGKSKRDKEEVEKSGVRPVAQPLSSEIPDIFFDQVLQHYKLSRQEIILLMYLYRQVWCRPNLYRPHGIGPLNSYIEMSTHLSLTTDELGTHLRSLEKLGFIITIRSGQYFVRKYFTEVLDAQYGQNYDEFF